MDHTAYVRCTYICKSNVKQDEMTHLEEPKSSSFLNRVRSLHSQFLLVQRLIGIFSPVYHLQKFINAYILNWAGVDDFDLIQLIHFDVNIEQRLPAIVDKTSAGNPKENAQTGQ